VFSAVRAARVAMQQCGKHISAAVNQHATVEEAVFSVGAAPRLHNEEKLKARVEAGSNTSTVALRVVGGDEKGTRCLGV
jgi:hypothetical protein